MIEEIAQAAAAGKNALDIARELNIHVRTVYKALKKWRERQENPPEADAPPPDYDTRKAMRRIIDRAIWLADKNPTQENLERITKLARASKAISLVPPGVRPSDSDIRRKLLAKLNMNNEALPPLPGEPPLPELPDANDVHTESNELPGANEVHEPKPLRPAEVATAPDTQTPWHIGLATRSTLRDW